MAPITAWRSVAAAVLAAALFACREEIAAPGRCPDLCPADSLVVVDTVINGVVVYDTSVRGYTKLANSPVMVAAALDSLTAYGVVRFFPVPQKWFPIAGDTVGVTVGTIDSVKLELRLDARDSNVGNTRILLFALPPARVDSNVEFDSLRASFQAGPFDSIPVPDSVRADSLRRLLPVASVTPQAADSFVVALGLGVRGDSATVAILSSRESGRLPTLRYYVHGAAPRDTFTNILSVVADFDSYVRNPPAPPPPPGLIVVGNQPAARAFLRLNIPRYYVDSVNVLRATLQLQLTKPVLGFPGETYTMTALPILRFFGGKSIIIPDTTSLAGLGSVKVGTTTTAPLEIARILRFWRGSNPDSLPRAIVVRSTAENFTFAEVVAQGAGGGLAAPRLEISFVRPFRFGVP